MQQLFKKKMWLLAVPLAMLMAGCSGNDGNGAGGGGAPPDTTRPTVSSTIPTAGTTGVAINRNITANFTRNPRLTILSTPETVALEGFRFSLNGELGEIYSVQKTSGLTNWTTFVTVTNLFGTTQISDSASTNSDPQFYRAIKP